jgi:hypothetical protein
MAIVALVAALISSGLTLVVDRIVLHDQATAELQREAAQRKADEDEAVRWMTGSPTVAK